MSDEAKTNKIGTPYFNPSSSSVGLNKSVLSKKITSPSTPPLKHKSDFDAFSTSLIRTAAFSKVNLENIPKNSFSKIIPKDSSSKSKFALVHCLDSNEFSVVSVQKINHDENEEIDEGGVYDIRHGVQDYKAIVKSISTDHLN